MADIDDANVTYQGATPATPPVGFKAATVIDASGNHLQKIVIGDGVDNADVVPLGTEVTTSDNGIVTNTVIHGKTTAGGAAYVDVKVSPSGAVQVGGTLDGITGTLSTLADASSSSTNNSTTPLAGNATFTGTGERNASTDVMVSCKTDATGTLYFDFSNDNTNWDTFPSAGFALAAGVHEFHNAVKGRRYFRVRLVNGSSAQSYLRLYTYYGEFRHGNAPLNASLSSDSDAIVTRSVLVGQTDGGVYVNVPVTSEGHIEAAIHSPRLPFGSIHSEKLTPIVQNDFVYGISATEVLTTTGLSVGTGANSGSVTSASNLATCATGTTQYSFASLQSRKRVRYRPGQGIVARFTALFSTPAASSTLVAGIGSGESGLFFGYDGTSFGILHSTGGVREIQTMTITTASTATNSYVVTLPNGATSTVTATNNGSTTKTAYEISLGTYSGWTASQRGATVVFVADSVGNKSGSFSLAQTGAGTPAAATVAETLAGVASTDTWTPQASWNGDVMDGTGSASNPSGVLLNPAKGNVFQIGVQYLGFGAITFQIEAVSAGNNADFINVHTLLMPNARTSVTLSNPSFPITAAAYSAGSTTNVSVSMASYAGMLEGDKKTTGARQSYDRDTNGFVGSTAATYYPLFTIRNERTYATRANQAVVNLLSMGCSHDDATPVIFYLIRNATLVGTPNFTLYASNSCTYWDTAATTCTVADRSQIVFSYQSSPSGGSGAFAFTDDITVQPGETITVAARALTGTAPWANASLNTREDI